MTIVEQTINRLVEQVERDLGLSAEELAGTLGVSRRTIDRWRAGEALPQPAARARLAELEALHRHLHLTFMPKAIPVWLRASNRYLGGPAPIEFLQAGRIERVEAALEAIDSGFFV